jgi:hypothetical protein
MGKGVGGVTKVGGWPPDAAFSVPLCAVCGVKVTASAVVVPDDSSNFQ